VSDYSRYLPRGTSGCGASFWWTYLGAFVGGAWDDAGRHGVAGGRGADASMSPAAMQHAADLVLPGLGKGGLLGGGALLRPESPYSALKTSMAASLTPAELR